MCSVVGLVFFVCGCVCVLIIVCVSTGARDTDRSLGVCPSVINVLPMCFASSNSSREGFPTKPSSYLSSAGPITEANPGASQLAKRLKTRGKQLGRLCQQAAASHEKTVL